MMSKNPLFEAHRQHHCYQKTPQTGHLFILYLINYVKVKPKGSNKAFLTCFPFQVNY